MNKFFNLLRAELLRALKFYPIIICFTLILALGIGGLFGGMLASRSESEEKTKFKIGLVGDTSDSYLGIGIFAVTNFDISKDYAEFVEMTEEEAVDELKNDRILGFVNIPEGFIQSVMRGDNIDIKFVMNKKPAMLGTLLIEEICSVVSDLVVYSQNGIYGYSDFLDGYSYAEYSDLIDKINIEYMACVFDRESAYEINELGYSDELSFEIYYLCAFSIILMLLWGICCCNLCVKKNYSLARSLKLGGRGALAQIFSEFTPFFLIITFNVFILLTAAGICVEQGVCVFPFIDSAETCLEFICIGVRYIPAITLICALQFLLFEICDGIISAVVLQVFSTVALSYLSGFLFPLYSLPSTIQFFARFLPTRIAFEYISSVLNDTLSIAAVFSTVLFTVALLVATVLIRNYRIRSERYV